MTEYDHLYKIILIGDSSVGKSSLIIRYTDNCYYDYFMTTIGVDMKIKNIITDSGKKIKLQIWDTSGQEKFRSVTNSYYRGVHCYILLFSLDDKETFHGVCKYMNLIEKYGNASMIKILVGTKCDLGERNVTPEEINNFVKENDLTYFETSSKYNLGIYQLFDHVANTLVNKNITLINNNNKKTLSPNVIIKEEKSCC